MLQKLRATYTRKPDSFVHGATSLHLLVAIILSAQCTDTKAFGKNVGIAVDTHVFRLARALGLSNARTPDKMSVELIRLFEPKDFLDVNEFLILHGRANPKLGRKKNVE